MQDSTQTITNSDPSAMVITVPDSATITVAANLMRDCGVGSLIVVDQNEEAVGIITERDIIFDCIAPGEDPASVTVSGIMTGDIVSVRPGASMQDADNLMAAHGIRHIPVVDNGRPVGMISARDVLSARLGLAQDMKLAAEQIALLSKSVRKLNLRDILDLVDDELPGIFGAKRLALYLAPEGRGGERKSLIRRTNCSCSPQTLADLAECIAPTGDSSHALSDPPESCGRAGAEGLRATAPLSFSESDDGELDCDESCSYLCMCGLPEITETSQDVFLYKLGLAADILSVNFANARLYQAAYRDTLTGLRTPRALDEALGHEYSHGLQHGETFCVAMLDVGRFKEMNEAFVNSGGDDMMRQLGASLLAGVRADDVAAKYSADEVAVLMPQTDLDQGMDVVERLRYKLKQELYISSGLTITASCGLAQWSGESEETAATVVRRAGKALDEARRVGNDCVVTDTGYCYARRV